MNLFTGLELKEQAHVAHEENRAELIRIARLALLRHLLANGTGTMDDVREVCEVPPGVSPTYFGGVPGGLTKSGIITRDGYRGTNRAKAKDRPIAVWRLVSRELAEVWINANTEEAIHAAAI